MDTLEGGTVNDDLALFDIPSLERILAEVERALRLTREQLAPVPRHEWTATQVLRLDDQERSRDTYRREIERRKALAALAEALPAPTTTRSRASEEHALVIDVREAVISAGLADDRNALLAGIPQAIVAALPAAKSLGAQVLTDVAALHEMGALPDGRHPFAIWLRNAAALTRLRRESAVFLRVYTALVP